MYFLKTALENTFVKDAFQQTPTRISNFVGMLLYRALFKGSSRVDFLSCKHDFIKLTATNGCGSFIRNECFWGAGGQIVIYNHVV